MPEEEVVHSKKLRTGLASMGTLPSSLPLPVLQQAPHNASHQTGGGGVLQCSGEGRVAGKGCRVGVRKREQDVCEAAEEVQLCGQVLQNGC